ncbi:diacylglycerol kinase family protein [Mucilaginibacter segetis]|uniref:Diacylglycerol kinase family protein n=1 Tax=Mucilaginibacter segetis TaxID=2793071 RepID=A0A934ULK4_9SPHI|nr:diacylglycerol kinase family protein [Mucilaginibacter segetis]MBK0378055.1 diacylglycerol kinase family protein [Mucilaginibacter segetis]
MKELISGFGFAFKGLKYAFATQLNFRIHTAAGFVAILAGALLHINNSEWLWVALCITMVLLTELLNTGVETLTDLVSPGYNKLAGHVKDITAAAVLITAIFALISGLVIFLPKILLLVTHHAA